MSALSSEFAEAELEELIEEFDGDYWLALAEAEGPPLDCGYRYDSDRVMWKWIPGFSNYEVSSDGRVRSYIHREPKDLKPWYSSYGYPYVQLVSDQGIKHKFTIHSLVANAFCYNPDPENYNVVRHMDDNPNNNDWTNLQFGTQAMNRQDMVDHGREFTKPVFCYETNYIYNSAAEAADALGISRSSVSCCCNGKIGFSNGYHICFASDIDEKLADPNWLDDSKSFGLRKVEATNLNTGETIIFNSRKEASEVLGIPNCGISSVVNGHLNHTHGWVFKDLSGEVKYA